MDFWQSQFPDSIHIVNYDQLVKHPEAEMKNLISFLKLEWNANCLNFHQVKNTVKTASVWQVRKPLYSSSSGRWKHYKKFISGLLSNCS